MATGKRAAIAVAAAAFALGLLSVTSPSVHATSIPSDLYGSATGGWGRSSGSESTPGPTFTVTQGDAVTITLHSTDGFQHEFLLDYNANAKADPGEPVSSVFTTTATVTFVANLSGSFGYICLFHPGSMKGSFVVQGTGTPNPSSGPATDLLDVLGFVGVAVAAVGVAALALRRRSGRA